MAGGGFFAVSQLDGLPFSAVASELGFQQGDVCEWTSFPAAEGQEFSSKEEFFNAFEANSEFTREEVQEVAEFRIRDGEVQYKACNGVNQQ